MRIQSCELRLRREKFVRPFGFKGSAFHEKWTPVVRLADEAGNVSIGVGGLTPLWSDSRVFLEHGEEAANSLQLGVLERALSLAEGREFADPMALHDATVREVHARACEATGLPDLRLTFTLVALSALDYAVWLLHAGAQGINSFEELVPEEYRSFLDRKQTHVALAPAIGYTLPEETLKALLARGAYVLKIKIGHAGSESEMLAKDIAWLDRIHALASRHETALTDTGRVLYYLDANGRYGEKQTMARLLEHCEKSGYLERVILVEEPYSRPRELDVHDLPARFAGDESVESADDVETRIQQGYGAFAIKTAGKTVSRCFRLVEAATTSGAVPFVADNACVPSMVEWNRNFAARLPAFPGVKGGIMESNGPENYGHWDALLEEMPSPAATWRRPQSGAFVLGDEFYATGGGIFETPKAYEKLFLT